MTNEANNTVTVSKTAETQINKMIDKGKPFSAIANAMVALDFVESMADAKAYLTEKGVGKSRKFGALDKVYSYLVDGHRTEEEFLRYIKENGSESMVKLFKQHDKVRQLTNRIHAKYAVQENAA